MALNDPYWVGRVADHLEAACGRIADAMDLALDNCMLDVVHNGIELWKRAIMFTKGVRREADYLAAHKAAETPTPAVNSDANVEEEALSGQE